MSCDTVRPVLFRIAENEATPDEALEAASHLDRCTACRILLARERRLGRHLEDDLEDLPVGEDFVRSVMDRVGTVPAPRRRRRLRLAALAGLGLGGAAILARVATTAPFGGLRAGLGPTDGPGALDDALPGVAVVTDTLRVLADGAAVLLPGPSGSGPAWLAVAAGLALTGATLVAIGSTAVALATGSVLRLVR